MGGKQGRLNIPLILVHDRAYLGWFECLKQHLNFLLDSHLIWNLSTSLFTKIFQRSQGNFRNSWNIIWWILVWKMRWFFICVAWFLPLSFVTNKNFYFVWNRQKVSFLNFRTKKKSSYWKNRRQLFEKMRLSDLLKIC